MCCGSHATAFRYALTSLRAVGLRPFQVTVPSRGLSWEAASAISVDFPAPFGPSSTVAGLLTRRSKPSSTVVFRLYRKETPRNSKAMSRTIRRQGSPRGGCSEEREGPGEVGRACLAGAPVKTRRTVFGF